KPKDADPHLRGDFSKSSGVERLSDFAGRSQKARPPQDRPRAGVVHFLRKSRDGTASMASQRNFAARAVDKLYEKSSGQIRLSASNYTAHRKQSSVRDFRSL